MPLPESERVRVLLVGSEAAQPSIAARLKKCVGSVASAADLRAALNLAGTQEFDAIVVGPAPETAEDRGLLQKLRTRNPEAGVIFVGGRSVPPVHVGSGDVEVIAAPVSFPRLEGALSRAHELARLRRENSTLKGILAAGTPTGEIVGKSAAIEAVRKLIANCAAKDIPILIEGEPGTGKELAARVLRAAGGRSDGPLVVVRTSALDARSVASELFGREKGAFRGARTEKRGVLELAHGGTVFIEDIAEADPATQAGLLRLIERRELLRTGSVRVRRVDARIIAATSRRIEEEVEQGRFRRDLFYRLNVLRIAMPPLRERVEDIPLLAKHFLRKLAGSRAQPKELSPEAIRRLQRYPWPGNVRELEHVVERAARLAGGNVIPAETVGALVTSEPVGPETPMTLDELLRRQVVRALDQSAGNKSRAATLLGISRRKLYGLMARSDAAERPV